MICSRTACFNVYKVYERMWNLCFYLFIDTTPFFTEDLKLSLQQTSFGEKVDITPHKYSDLTDRSCVTVRIRDVVFKKNKNKWEYFRGKGRMKRHFNIGALLECSVHTDSKTHVPDKGIYELKDK